jgi:hypothetical protein
MKETIFGKDIDSIARDGRTITIKMKEEVVEVGLLQIRDHNRLDCTSCIAPTNNKCEQWRKELTGSRWKTCGTGMKYYANKAQIEDLVAKWDQHYIDEGGLFVCSDAKRCNDNFCIFKEPVNNNRYPWGKGCNAPMGRQGSYPVPYRGERPEPAVEDCSVVEYVILKNISVPILAKTNIDPVVFKKTFNSMGSGWFKSGYDLDDKCREASAIPELIRLGFIKEKVNDPKVSLGNKFENHEGTWMAVNSFPDYMHLVLIEKADKDDHTIQLGMPKGKSFPFGKQCKLSDLIGHDLLKDFRRVD